MNDMKKFLEMSHIQLQRIPLAVKCGIAVAVCALFIVHWFLQEEALGYAYADAFCQSVTMTGADQHLDAYDAIMDRIHRVVEEVSGRALQSLSRRWRCIFHRIRALWTKWIVPLSVSGSFA